jgi:deazaflavin-dependent oxidoreductase (nitroreductase family)
LGGRFSGVFSGDAFVDEGGAMAVTELKSALESATEIEITVTGRRSGREISNPVWFAHDDEKLYLLPVRGSDTEWYKNVRKTPTMRVSVNGAEVTATARPITDPATVHQVIEKFRAKYGTGSIKKYYEKLDVAVEVPLR